jgi:hypothetical protein
MDAARQRAIRRRRLLVRDEELVGPEVILRFSADRNLQYVENGLVETLARREILHDELDVVDQSPAMQFLGFHERLSFGCG